MIAKRNMPYHLTRLEAKREELAQHLRSLGGGLEVIHTAEAEENAQLALNREEAAGEIRRTRQMLAAVNDAIARWKSGEYGRCTSCSKPISAKRLTAVPEASRCLPCAVNEVLRW